MRCPDCASERPHGAKFCAECGARLVNACPRCGHQADPSAKFCQECGGPLGSRPDVSRPDDAQMAAAAPAPTPEPAGPAPRGYTPPHLAARILANRDALEGERKHVTVLFTDLTGSTELIQDLDPEDARALLEPAVNAMIAAVHRFEGTVCRVMGDGIMALFGAPLAHEDHAARACYAALTMQDALRRYGEAAREQHGVEILARVGLNSGEVVVGSISNDLYVEYSAIGPTTHLAARMEQLAVPGTIRLTAETLALVDGLVEVRSLGRIPVRGVVAPVSAFELLAATAGRRRFQATASRGLTPFVGRRAELEALQRALDRAQTGQGQVVAPVGEPGVGKSRLFHEFVHSHHTAGWLVLESGSVSYGKATPYLPVIDLLKAYCRIEPSDDARTAREKVVGKVLTLDRALETILTPLLALLDLPVDEVDWDTLDPPQRRRRTLDALLRLLLRESQEQPLLLVFEDLHWIDAETQALLDSLIESLPTARILLLVNYRPEYRHAWGSKSYYTQLRIDPLGQDGADELLDALLGHEPGIAPLRALLVERTGGNPFFLEESLRALVETSVLSGDRGAYHLTQPVTEVRVPATVQAVLAARIDRLPPPEKRLLQSAAVIGKDVPFRLLLAIAGQQEADLQAGISHLQAAELVYPVSLFPEAEYTFKHALTHEVTYGSLLQERRRTIHNQIVDALERLYPDRLDEQAERLAHHALRGELWAATEHYARRATQKSHARSAYREAAAFCEQVILALQHLPDDVGSIERNIDARLELRSALAPLGEHDRMLTCLQEAESLAEALGDARRQATAAALLVDLFWRLGLYDQAIEANTRALAFAEASGDVGVQILATYYVGNAYWGRNDYRAAVRMWGRTFRLTHGEDLRPVPGMPGLPALQARGNRAWCLAELGQFAEGIDGAEEGIRLGRQGESPYSLALLDMHLGGLYLRRGDLPSAISVLERGRDLCLAFEYRFYLPWVESRLGMAYALAGRLDDGLALLESTTAPEVLARTVSDASLRIAWLAEAYLLANRTDEATALATRARELAVERIERGHQAWAEHLLGEIAARREPSDSAAAEGRYQEALGIAEELGMRPLQAHCHLGLGKLYRQIGRQDAAARHLTTAVTMLREMGMTLWLTEAEAALA